jgi:hypothetical protein
MLGPPNDKVGEGDAGCGDSFIEQRPHDDRREKAAVVGEGKGDAG